MTTGIAQRLQLKAIEARLLRYFPCPFERGSTLLVIVGMVSTLLYVFSRICFRGQLADLLQSLMVLTFLVSAWGLRHRLKSDLVFRLLILALLIPLVLLGINALIDYETAIKYRSLNDLLNLFLFLPVAWWLGGSRAGAEKMLIIAFLGLVTAVALDPNLGQNLSGLWAGQRVHFNIHNAQHGAMFFGLVIIFCGCSLVQRLQPKPAVNRANVLLAIVTMLCLVGLLGTRTRGAMLGLFVVGFIALLRMAWHRIRAGEKHPYATRGVLVLILVAGLLAWPTMNVIKARFAAEQTTFHSLLTGNLQEVPVSSFGIRVHSWAAALQWIAERPLTGWGQKARSDVIQLSQSIPEQIKQMGFGHLHNGYLEILVGYGAVGLVFVVALWIVMWSRIRQAASNDLFAFALYGGIFFLAVNLSESFFIYWSGEFALALIMSGGYSQYLSASLGSEVSRVTQARNFPDIPA